MSLSMPSIYPFDSLIFDVLNCWTWSVKILFWPLWQVLFSLLSVPSASSTSASRDQIHQHRSKRNKSVGSHDGGEAWFCLKSFKDLVQKVKLCYHCWLSRNWKGEFRLAWCTNSKVIGGTLWHYPHITYIRATNCYRWISHQVSDT